MPLVMLNWHVWRDCESSKAPLDTVDQGGPSRIQAKYYNIKIMIDAFVMLNWHVWRDCESSKAPLDTIDQGGPSRIQAKYYKNND